ncbi:MAG: EF-Tu/IF-2/RF-3 family GTPase [bacterium]
MAETQVGHVSDYFAKIGVAGIEISSGELRVGDTIHILGHTTDFTQKVESMQIEHEQVEAAKAGDSVGIKVDDRCRSGDKVFLVTD